MSLQNQMELAGCHQELGLGIFLLLLFHSVCFFTATPTAVRSPPSPTSSAFQQAALMPCSSPIHCRLPPSTPTSFPRWGTAVLGCSSTARESRLSWESVAPAPPLLQSQGDQPSLSLSAPCSLTYRAPPALLSQPALQDKQHRSYGVRAGGGVSPTSEALGASYCCLKLLREWGSSSNADVPLRG